MSDAQIELGTEETRALIENFHSAFGQIRQEVRKIIVGQDDVVEHLLLTLLLKPHQPPMPLQHQQKHQLLSNS